MKIYTKTGDKGKSSLLSGERVAKNSSHMEAYGDVDELNAIIGALMATLPESANPVLSQLQQIQSDLFHVGAGLATTPGSTVGDQLSEVTDEYSRRLEDYIDALQDQLPELKAFILPGGHTSAAWAHMARTVCRRAERRVVDLAEATSEGEYAETLGPIMIYINRLSDYLFVLARYCNQVTGQSDRVWKS